MSKAGDAWASPAVLHGVDVLARRTFSKDKDHYALE